MKSFLKIGAMTCILLISSTLFAQRHPDRRMPPPVPNEQQITQMVHCISHRLSLDNTQEQSLLKLFQAHFKEVRTLLKKQARNRRVMEELRKKFDFQLESLLGKEQKHKLDRVMQEMHARKGPEKQNEPDQRQRKGNSK